MTTAQLFSELQRRRIQTTEGVIRHGLRARILPRPLADSSGQLDWQPADVAAVVAYLTRPRKRGPRPAATI